MVVIATKADIKKERECEPVEIKKWAETEKGNVVQFLASSSVKFWSFDSWYVTRSLSNGKRAWVGRYIAKALGTHQSPIKETTDMQAREPASGWLACAACPKGKWVFWEIQITEEL